MRFINNYFLYTTFVLSVLHVLLNVLLLCAMIDTIYLLIRIGFISFIES